MAKQWKPTQKQLTTYEALIKKYNKIRKQIISAHKSLESRTPTGLINIRLEVILWQNNGIQRKSK